MYTMQSLEGLNNIPMVAMAGGIQRAATVADLHRLIQTGKRLHNTLGQHLVALADDIDALYDAGMYDDAMHLAGFWSSIKNGFKKIGRGIKKAASWVGGKIKKAAKTVVGIIPGGKQVWNAASKVVGLAKKSIGAVVGAIKGKKKRKANLEEQPEEMTFAEKIAKAKAFRKARKDKRAAESPEKKAERAGRAKEIRAKMAQSTSSRRTQSAPTSVAQVAVPAAGLAALLWFL